jgi:cytochrome c oxidase assembly protein subunit 11
MQPGETRQWPVVFVIDSKLPKDVTTITLSYTFFEVGGKVPMAPVAAAAVEGRAL